MALGSDAPCLCLSCLFLGKCMGFLGAHHPWSDVSSPPQPGGSHGQRAPVWRLGLRGAGTEPTHTGPRCSLAGSCPPPAGTAPSTRLHPVGREARQPSCQERTLPVLLAALMKGLFRSLLPLCTAASWLLLFLPRPHAPGCPPLMRGRSRRTHSLRAPSKQTAWIPSRGHCPCSPSLGLLESLQYLDREHMTLTNYHPWIPFIPHSLLLYGQK